MSSYFDGLMRASGLPVGRAPVIGVSAQPTLPLTETNVSVSSAGSAMGTDDATVTDVAVPMARPMISPLDVTVRSVQRAVAADPVRAEATTPPQPPGIAAGRPFPTAAAQAVPSSPQQDTADQTLAIASHRATAPPAIGPSTEHVISGERIIQAAMRWVAAGPVSGPALLATPPEIAAAARPATDPAHQPGQGPSTTQAIARGSSGDATMIVQPAKGQPSVPPRRSVAEPVQPAAAVPLRPIVPRSPPEDSVQVSIGEIHLRVEAPAVPTMVAAPEPMRRPQTGIQAAPRSGLSRRALRRI